VTKNAGAPRVCVVVEDTLRCKKGQQLGWQWWALANCRRRAQNAKTGQAFRPDPRNSPSAERATLGRQNIFEAAIQKAKPLKPFTLIRFRHALRRWAIIPACPEGRKILKGLVSNSAGFFRALFLVAHGFYPKQRFTGLERNVRVGWQDWDDSNFRIILSPPRHHRSNDRPPSAAQKKSTGMRIARLPLLAHRRHSFGALGRRRAFLSWLVRGSVAVLLRRKFRRIAFAS